jgi:hypothetical protein
VASTILRPKVRTGGTAVSPFQIEKLLDEQLLCEITGRGVSPSELALCNPMVEEFLLAILGSHVGISNFVSEHVIAQLQAEIATLRLIENSAEATAEAPRVTTIVNDAVPLHLSDDRSTLKQPQLFCFALVKSVDLTVTIFPQMHLQTHIVVFHLSFSSLSNTVNLSKTLELIGQALVLFSLRKIFS